MLIFTITCLFFLILYFKVYSIYSYWKQKGVPFVNFLRCFGDYAENMFLLNSYSTSLEKIYTQYKNERYVGFYQFLQPVLLIRDPELIKTITIKDFDAFTDHSTIISADVDTLWTKNLFTMTSETGWKTMRSKISPFFTSRQLRRLLVLVQDCANNFVEHLATMGDKTTIETKDLFSRFANDVIGNAVFGVTSNSLKSNNDFYTKVKEATDLSSLRGLKFLALSFCPALMKLMNVKIFKTTVSVFFRDLIKESIKIRKDNKITHPDVVNLLMEMRWSDDTKHEMYTNSQFERNNKLTEEDITAQAVVFLIAGFDSVSNVLSYIAYELAVNADIQKNLYEEIQETFECCNGSLTYDVLLSMKYLNNVVMETLRLHPPACIIDRKCVKPYVIKAEKLGERPLVIEKNTWIWILHASVQKDEKYFPNPEKFDPDRFNTENKHNHEPYTYLPFGLGPRQCVGSRFALLEMKLLLVELLKEYELVVVEKTQIPMNPILANDENKLWLGLNRRK